MREFFLHTRGHAVLRSSAQNFLDRGEGQGIHGHTRPDGPTCALWRGRSFQPGKTRKNARNSGSFLQVSAPANERRQCDSAVAYTGLGPLCRLSSRRFSAWGPPSHTHTAPHGRKAFRFVLDPLRLGKPAPFRFFWARGPARLPVGKKSCTNGGTRYYAVAPKTFLTGGRGKEYTGTHARTGPPAHSGAGVASSQERHAKTPAIQGRFCKCLRQPMSGANATALSHIRAWGPSAGFPAGVFLPGGLPRTRTRHRTGARLSALSWTRCDWESPPLFAFFLAGVSHVCPWGKNLA